MKKYIFTGLLIFSIALNLAVAGTLLWHLWPRPDYPFPGLLSSPTRLSSDDLAQIRRHVRDGSRSDFRAQRRRIREKRREILELLARAPHDRQKLAKATDELVDIRSEMERAAVNRLTRIAGDLPPSKRAAFLRFLWSRACRRGGMGWSRFDGHHGGRRSRGR